MVKKAFEVIVAVFLALNVTFGQETDSTMSYLALGDSYTIGESVKKRDQWPRQLRDSLASRGIRLKEPRIIAKTGWRTDEMLNAAESEVQKDSFDLVSLLIGVNNEYQGRSPESFETEFEKCLEFAIERSKHGVEGVFVLSIPDYGFTPFGAKKKAQITKRLNEYNKICKEICRKQGVLFINITDISRKVPDDPTLLASDKLHPSRNQYAKWVERALPSVVDLIMN